MKEIIRNSVECIAKILLFVFVAFMPVLATIVLIKFGKLTALTMVAAAVVGFDYIIKRKDFGAKEIGAAYALVAMFVAYVIMLIFGKFPFKDERESHVSANQI